MPRVHDFTLPEDFFELKEVNIKKDAFLSNDYYQFPYYYLDVDRILVLKKELPLVGNVLEITESQLIDKMSELLASLTTVDENKGFYLPIFYYNYHTGSYQHFGFLIVTKNLISRNRLLFTYYPLQFFPLNYMITKGNSSIVINILKELPEYAVDQHVQLFNIRGFEKQCIISSRLSQRRIPFNQALEIINNMKTLIAEWFTMKEKIINQYIKALKLSNKNHKENVCALCNEEVINNRKKFTIKNIHLKVCDILSPPKYDKVVDKIREKKVDLGSCYEINPRKFYKEFVPFGNPFKYTIKLKPEKNSKYILEDEVMLYDPRKHKKNYKSEYNTMKRTEINKYIKYAQSTDANQLMERLNKSFNSLSIKNNIEEPQIFNKRKTQTNELSDKEESIDTDFNTVAPNFDIDELTLFGDEVMDEYNPIDACLKEFDKLESILIKRNCFIKTNEFLQLHSTDLKIISEHPKINSIIQEIQY